MIGKRRVSSEESHSTTLTSPTTPTQSQCRATHQCSKLAVLTDRPLQAIHQCSKLAVLPYRLPLMTQSQLRANHQCSKLALLPYLMTVHTPAPLDQACPSTRTLCHRSLLKLTRLAVSSCFCPLAVSPRLHLGGHHASARGHVPSAYAIARFAITNLLTVRVY